jgi:phage terminase large subunit-like protein
MVNYTNFAYKASALLQTNLLLANTDTISDYALEMQERYKNNFYLFIKDAWSALEGSNVPFIDNWHIQAIAEHLEACNRGDIKFLIVNMPPRCMKSTIISIMFPAWVWGRGDTWKKFLCGTFAAKLSNEHSLKCRDLLNSQWYKEIFGNIFRLRDDNNAVQKFANSKKGYRIAASVGGSTGQGGDIIILDDPNDTKDMDSQARRDAANNWYDRTISDRLNDKQTGCKIILQHRPHMEDVSGHILELEKDLVHLRLPMRFEQKYRCSTVVLPSTNGKKWRDPRHNEGDLLWPEKHPKKYIDKEEKVKGPFAFAALYQQRPSPMQGGIFTKDDFMIWSEEYPPDFLYIIQSWDTALVGKKADESSDPCMSVCTTWGVFKNFWGLTCIMLLELYADHIEFHVMREMAQRMAHNYKDTDYDNPIGGKKSVDYVLIETKTLGDPLMNELYMAGIPTKGFNPQGHGGKVARARSCLPEIATGRVYVRESFKTKRLFKHAEKLLEAAINFPSHLSDDIIDTMSQILITLKREKILVHEDIYEEPENETDFNIFNYQ